MYFQIQELTAFYGKSQILQGINLEMDQGEILTLLGRNGVGKSTTLRSIMGIVKPASGVVIFKDRKIQGLKPHHIPRLGIGYVPEDRRIFPRLTVRENLLMGKMAMKKKERSTGQAMWDLERIFSTFPMLQERENQKGATLSGGEQQILTTARTLMGNPELILVDELSEGLAPLILKTMMESLYDINQHGVSILLVEQNMNVALALAKRAYVMNKGQIVFSGTSAQLGEAEDIRHRYLEV
jgi:branched-chain amino acid transport system ATP-binding protein